MSYLPEKVYNKYDEEPVLYCKDCLSLNIKAATFAGEDMDYCDSCGGTNLGQCDIREWEKMYVKKYGKEYVDRTRRSIYF